MPSFDEKFENRERMEHYLTLEIDESVHIRLFLPTNDPNSFVERKGHYLPLNERTIYVPCLGPNVCRTIKMPDGTPLHDTTKADGSRTYATSTSLIVWNVDAKKLQILEKGGKSLVNKIAEWKSKKKKDGTPMWGGPENWDIIMSCERDPGPFKRRYEFQIEREDRPPMTEEEIAAAKELLPTLIGIMNPTELTVEEINERIAYEWVGGTPQRSEDDDDDEDNGVDEEAPDIFGEEDAKASPSPSAGSSELPPDLI